MKVMLLAAGRGERLRPLTDKIPKPLLTVAGKPLIVHHLEKLARAQLHDVVINIAHLGQQIRDALGDGSRYDVRITYSAEPPGALETGGGIFQALPLLGAAPFLVISSDIFTDFDFATLPTQLAGLAHFIVVPNPPYHLRGDFGLHAGQINNEGPLFNYGNIGVYHPEFFAGCKPGIFKLLPLMQRAITAGKVSGELYRGLWHNIGTAADLAALQT